MPRSYSFEHFTVGKRSAPRAMARKAKQKQQFRELSPTGGPNDEKIHYGHAHQETEALFQARSMERELESLAGLEPVRRVSDVLPEEPQGSVSTPIGAIPSIEMPSGQEQKVAGFRELLAGAQQDLLALKGGVGDAWNAVRRLARTPKEVALMLGRRLPIRF